MSDRVLVVAPCGEEIGPGFDLGMLLEKSAALTFGHASPDTELDSIVEGVGAALEHYGAVSADDCGFALCGASHEQFIGIDLAASCPGNPGDASFCLVDVQPCRRGGHVHSVAPLLSEPRYAVFDLRRGHAVARPL